MGGLHNGQVKAVVGSGVAERIGVFQSTECRGDPVPVQPGRPLCRQAGRLTLKLLPYFQQIIEGSGVAFEKMHQRALLTQIVGAGNHAGHE